MTSTFSTFTEFVMVDTRLARGAVWLPVASNFQGRRITIKDAYGTFGNSTCQIAASNDDLFDDNTSFKFISTNYASLSFIAISSIWYGLSSNTFNQGNNFPTLSASNLTVSSMNYVNINPSTMNMWVAVGIDTNPNNTIKYSLNGMNWSNSLGSAFDNAGEGVAWNGNMWVAVGGDTGANTIKYSYNGINWSNAIGSFSEVGEDVAWNGRMWVATGLDVEQNNTIKYSYDGINWSNSSGTGFTDQGLGVSWNGNMWLAIGNDASPTKIKYSYNGINWLDAQGATFTGPAFKTAWNGRMWVAVGSDLTASNTIKYSYNGINWFNSFGIGFSGQGQGVAWNGRMWVATGKDGSPNNTIKYSYDGINWSNSLGQGFSVGGRGIVWNGNFWIVVGEDTTLINQIKYSYDGLNWSNTSGLAFTSNVVGIGFSSNIIPSYSQSNLAILPQNIPTFLTSTNSILAQPSSLIINDSLIIDRQWDRVGINCNIPQYSLDVNGTVNVSTLNIQSTPVQNIIGSTITGLGTFAYISTGNLQSTVVGLGSNDQSTVRGLGATGYISTLSLQSTVTGLGSNDQSTVRGLGATGYISSLQLFSTVSGLPTAYPILGGGGTTNLQALTVSTGFLFAGRTPNVNVVPSSMTMWVAVGDDTTPAARIKYSQNGQFWTNAQGDTFSGIGRGVAFNGRMWVAVGGNGTGNSNATIKTSSNGIDWTNVTSGGFTSEGRGVAWNGNYWVAVGSDGVQNARLKWSSNGTDWNNSLGTGFTSQGIAVAWNGRMWVAVGQGSGAETIKWSTNGSNWNNSSNGAFSAGRGVAWNGRMWVAVGLDTTQAARIKYSYDGFNWCNSVSGAFSIEGRGIAWNGRMWVAVGQDAIPNNSLKYSYDGMNWSNSLGDGFDDTTNTNTTWGITWSAFSTWVATGFDNIGATNNNIKFSTDGVNWNNSSGSGFSSNGNAVAYASNTTPAYSQANLNILPQTIPLFYNTNTIFTQPSSMILNETLTIDAQWDRVGINCNIPQYALDVFGDVNVSTFNIQGTPVQTILGSTIVGLGAFGYVSSPSLQSTVSGIGSNNQSTVTGLGATGYISSLSLRSTVVGLGATGYISSLQLFSTVSGLPTAYPALAGGGTTNLQALTISTGTLFASTMSYVNINTSSMNMWVATGFDGTASNRLKYSLDGITWANSSGTGATFSINANNVAFNGRTWVAVGGDSTNQNKIKYSTDGITWFNSSASGATFSGNVLGVAWNGRIWMATGVDANTMKFSTDGITWANSGTGFTSYGWNVAWNGRLWVAVGNDSGPNTIKYSADGLTWSNSQGVFTVEGKGIAWNGRIWVATGDDGTVNNRLKYSADGITWSNSAGIGFSIKGNAVAWNGRLFVAVGGDAQTNNTIKYSTDGINWSNSAGPGFSQGFGIAWNGRIWVAAGNDATTAANRLKYSFDGISWFNSSGSGATFSTDGGTGVAFSSNTIPAYAQSNLSILPQNIPVFLTSTNTIFAQPSSLVINDTLIIDGQWDRVGINSNIPQFSLDVNGPARTMMPISSLCNTTANVGITGHGIFYYITNSGFNGLTLPSIDPIGGWFASLRNNTGTTLSVTISGTNAKIPASPFSISPANTVTLAYDTNPPTGGCNWVYF